MPNIDYDVMIRDRAYEIWERAGRPLGLEHEHWAQARVEIERETSAVEVAPVSTSEVASPATTGVGAEPAEATRMRQALYCPEPFSFELFGQECPKIDSPIVLKQGPIKAQNRIRKAA